MSKRKHLRDPEQMERRTFRFEFREAPEPQDGATPKLVGYAAVFNQETELYPGVFEKIAPGAFAVTIANADIRAVWNHNTDIVLGRSKNGTLRLWEDATGLGTEINPPNTDLISDMCVAPIRRGDVSEMSFAFYVLREEWKEQNDGTLHITLMEIALIEVSPCTIPAYAQTSISARSAEKIEEFQERQRQAALVQSEPSSQDVVHSDPEQPEATPVPAEHPEESAPLAQRHLDEDLFLRLDLAKRKLRAA